MATAPMEDLREADASMTIEEMLNVKRGTAMDEEDMLRVGKRQQLNRIFNLTSILGFTAVFLSTWEAVLIVPSYALPNGGLAGMVWLYIVVFLGFIPVYLSLAEMASMAPTSGGQYHWVSEFAPKNAQKFLSYLSGWLCVLGWQAGNASACYLAALETQALISLNVPTYVAQPYQGTLMVIAVALIAISFNTFGLRKLPLIEGVVLLIHVFGFFLILIPLWVLAPRNSTTDVFTQFQNEGGWSNQGLACLVGMIGPIYMLGGADSSAHMAEEIRNAAIVLPWAMIWTLLLNGSLGIVMVITFAFCLGNVQDAITPTYGFAYIDMFVNVFGPTAASVGIALLILLGLFATVSNVAAASRQMFAFARDGGLPFSAALCRVRPGWNVPLNSIIVSLIVIILLSLINLGSSVAFNAVISLSTGALLSSYMLVISCLILKRIRKAPLPRARFSLGRAGLAVNIVALAFVSLAWLFSFFPLSTPTTAAYMNWASLLYGGAIIFSIVYFLVWGRHTYTGPVVQVKREE